jgi:D-tagatose-1,6-bisphosphate aldolase subunit GatZ/KbaZ
VVKTASRSTEESTSCRSLHDMRALLKENRAGKRKGIYSVCSANRLVLEATFAQAANDKSLLLIEATCNQVNQEGGYTGLTPAQFRNYVHAIAEEKHFPRQRLILGGDHLGPNPWRALPAQVAMEKACAMVSSYAAAGFNKIHLDASMRCGSDTRVLTSDEIAERAAQLCEAAEAATRTSSYKPVYIIGTEVPTPGGAQTEIEIEITTTTSLRQTLYGHQRAFLKKKLFSALDRIVGVVVQPGIEFGQEVVVDYVSTKASELTRFIREREGIVFEAHSTDYQTEESLRQLVSDHFAILKVGPELTFVMREAIFGLARIEEEWITSEKQSHIRTIIDQTMVQHPENWRNYYHGNESRVRVARAYSFSDRIRYYWPNSEISRALVLLVRNLQQSPAPLTLIAQYLPRQAEAIRAGTLENNPKAIIHHKIRESLSRYADACGFTPRACASRHGPRRIAEKLAAV